MARMLSQQAWVFWPMEPLTRFAEASAGIWPETKIWPLARTAWDCIFFLIEVSWVIGWLVGWLAGKVCCFVLVGVWRRIGR